MITRRFATVEPVFGNLRGNQRLDRFTRRGRNKVDGRWKRYCRVHNIEQLAHHGYAHGGRRHACPARRSADFVRGPRYRTPRVR